MNPSEDVFPADGLPRETKVVIVGHMTIVVENVHEIPDFIRKRDEFGFEHINFGYDKKVPPYLADNPELKDELIRTILRLHSGCIYLFIIFPLFSISIFWPFKSS